MYSASLTSASSSSKYRTSLIKTWFSASFVRVITDGCISVGKFTELSEDSDISCVVCFVALVQPVSVAVTMTAVTKVKTMEWTDMVELE